MDDICKQIRLMNKVICFEYIHNYLLDAHVNILSCGIEVANQLNEHFRLIWDIWVAKFVGCFHFTKDEGKLASMYYLQICQQTSD